MLPSAARHPSGCPQRLCPAGGARPSCELICTPQATGAVTARSRGLSYSPSGPRCPSPTGLEVIQRTGWGAPPPPVPDITRSSFFTSTRSFAEPPLCRRSAWGWEESTGAGRLRRTMKHVCFQALRKSLAVHVVGFLFPVYEGGKIFLKLNKPKNQSGVFTAQ